MRRLMKAGRLRSILRPGDRLVLAYAGGGGYGEPASRDPAAVCRDVRNDYVSEEAARTVYGVKL